MSETKEPSIDKVKRGPGRPPEHKNKKETQKRQGIINQPSNQLDKIELRYCDPMIFKILWSHLKVMEVNNIQILFRKDDIVLYGHDHSENSSIYVRAAASKFDMYYCEEELDIGISHKTTLAYMNTIDKKDTQFIDIVSKIADCKESIRIIFRTCMGSIENHKINLTTDYVKLTKEREKEFLNCANYKISFKLPSKYFKKKMNDISLCKTSTVDFIQEKKDNPLVIAYEAENKCATSRIPFQNNSKINFKSGLADGETFRISALLDDLKSISSVGFTNDIEIYMDEDKSILFKTQLDDAFELRILTKIVTEQ